MEQIKLDIVPVGISPVAHASQFDNGRQIRFNLFNQGTPYTLTGAETVTMVVNGEEEAITNTSDNYVIWDVAEEDCEEVGVIGCEIRIVLGSMLIGSKNFFLEVEMDPYDGKNVHVVTVGPADICTFETTLAEPLSVTVDVEATGGYDADTQTAHPIVGYTEANITRCGVNLWDEVWEEGNIDPTTGNPYSEGGRIRSKNFSAIKGDIEVYIIDPTNNWNVRLFYYDANKTYLGASSWSNTGTKTTLTGACYFKIAVGGAYGGTYNNDIAILYPSSEHNYHAYTGNTYTIAFGQTVFGGQLDVTRGKLHVTHGKYTLNDVSNLTRNSDHSFYFGATPSPKATGTAYYVGVMSDKFMPGETANQDVIFIHPNGFVRFNTANAYQSASDCFTAIGEITVVYPLATPIDIDLTPEVISAIVGTNNVFADCGQTTVKYLKAE